MTDEQARPLDLDAIEQRWHPRGDRVAPWPWYTEAEGDWVTKPNPEIRDVNGYAVCVVKAGKATREAIWQAPADIAALIAEVRALRAEQARLARDLAAARATLAHYADAENWRNAQYYWVDDGKAHGYDVARAALGQQEATG